MILYIVRNFFAKRLARIWWLLLLCALVVCIVAMLTA